MHKKLVHAIREIGAGWLSLLLGLYVTTVPITYVWHSSHIHVGDNS